MGATAVSDLNAAVARTTKVTRRGRIGKTAAREPVGRTAEAAALLRMRESHHRIKNHLQVLTSLLAIGSRQNPDESARQALLDACSRISAVARLHQRLEDADLGDCIDADLFLGDLCADLRACFGGDNNTGLKLDLEAEATSFPSKTMLPLGLVVNELVTNAVKHGGRNEPCSVTVRLRREEDRWRLTVSDDGPGMGQIPFPSQSRLGGRLLHALANQLDGSIEVDKTATGASISVLFRA